MALNTEMENEPIPFDVETPADLVFDDDSIESILYDPSPAPPTEASIFAQRLIDAVGRDPKDDKPPGGA